MDVLRSADQAKVTKIYRPIAFHIQIAGYVCYV